MDDVSGGWGSKLGYSGSQVSTKEVGGQTCDSLEELMDEEVEKRRKEKDKWYTAD